MLTLEDFSSEDPIAWCPGCGNFSILKALKKALVDIQQPPEDLVIVSGIGQAPKTPHYLRCNCFNGLHGRTLPVATGIKLANHRLTVLAQGGDGDGYGEGGNHFLHAMRRNINITYLVHNNQVYGLTKGQASPTSDVGFVTKIQTHGVISQPVSPLALAVVEDCSFVARSSSVLPEHLEETMCAALAAEGFALLDILQPCVSFNKVNTYKWYKDRVRPLPASHDPRDRAAALAAALTWGDQIPVGVIYRSDRPAFEKRLGVLENGPLAETYGKR
jgi:2-oxoglutarate ferredoxin oxidoreductase subunit beta